MVNTGFKLVMGSWNITDILLPRMEYISCCETLVQVEVEKAKAEMAKELAKVKAEFDNEIVRYRKEIEIGGIKLHATKKNYETMLVCSCILIC